MMMCLEFGGGGGGVQKLPARSDLEIKAHALVSVESTSTPPGERYYVPDRLCGE
jgi:hypothetical protein